MKIERGHVSLERLGDHIARVVIDKPPYNNVSVQLMKDLADVLAEVDPTLVPLRPTVPSEEDWSARTASSKKQVEDLDRLLDEQEQAWASWQESYAAWRSSLEQLPR